MALTAKYNFARAISAENAENSGFRASLDYSLLPRYFHKLGIGAEVLGYTSEAGADFLLTARVAGEDCTYRKYLDEPKRLAAAIAEELRKLHEADTCGCPIERMPEYFKTVNEGRLIGRCDTSYYTDLFGEASPEKVFALFEDGKNSLDSRVLLHGDFCLPNIILKDFSLSGYIDLGNGGIGDRHIDIYWGIWTLRFNLGTDKYDDIFIDAYGRELVDKEKIKTVASAECFG